MSFHPLHLWASMTLMSKIITGGLLSMGVIALAVLFERLWYLSNIRRETDRFMREASELIDLGRFAEVLPLATRCTQSPVAKSVAALVRKFSRETSKNRTAQQTFGEMLRREALRQSEEISVTLRRGMGALATIGSIAPFVGLLGTVVGIIAAFRGIATTGSGGLGSVSAGISEALVETALGLMVAIPTVVIYNYLNGRLSEVESTVGRTVSELSDEMEREYERVSGEFNAVAA